MSNYGELAVGGRLGAVAIEPCAQKVSKAESLSRAIVQLDQINDELRYLLSAIHGELASDKGECTESLDTSLAAVLRCGSESVHLRRETASKLIADIREALDV